MQFRIRKILKWIGVVGILLATFFLGMYSYKNESIRKKITSVYNIKNFSYEKYKMANNATPDVLSLVIPDSSQAILDQCRTNAIADGILRNKNKIEVPALIIHNSDTLHVDIRLKGDYSDHWAGEKISYRVSVNNGQRLYGMKSFSLQSPTARKELNEWYYFELLKAEGLIALRYDFISLIENGKEKGIYAIEESFSKELIENNRRREAPILKFDESILIDKSIINSNETFSQTQLFKMAKIDVFKTKKTLKNEILNSQYIRGRDLLERLRSREITATDAIDINKAAMLFAIADLTGGHHSLRWKNMRFYYSPVINKLELIGFDAIAGNTINDIYYFNWKNKRIGEFEELSWKNIFFEDSIFVNSYFQSIEKLCEDNYLANFNAEIKEKFDQKLSILYSENMSYSFHHHIFEANIKTMRNALERYNKSIKPVHDKYFVEAFANVKFQSGNESIKVTISNNNSTAITVLGVYNTDEQPLSTNNAHRINSSDINFKPSIKSFMFNLVQPLDSTQADTKRRENSWVYKKIKIAYKIDGYSDTLYTRIQKYYDKTNNTQAVEVANTSPFTIDLTQKKVQVAPGTWSFKNDIIIPKGFSFNCVAGTTINLLDKANLVVNGPINLIGKKENPIVIKSTDSSGTIIVFQTNSTSIVQHCNFIGLAESYHSQLSVSGAVNFYEADVKIENTSFSNNKSEDALNIIRSNFEINKVNFLNIFSDAFDGDFCKGSILDATFKTIGNDALDFSGSQIEMTKIKIDKVGDKGISAGESSTITCNDVTILNSEIGFVSKDQSKLVVNKGYTENVALPFVVFCKKQAFGQASIKLSNFSSKSYKEAYLIEKGSVAIVNADSIAYNSYNVFDELYGNKYGKSSK